MMARGRTLQTQNGGGSTPKRRVRLDRDIEDILVAATDVRRSLDRELKSFRRREKLSDRGLFIIHIVNAGLNWPSALIDYFDVLPSTITVEIEKLVQAGLLTRHAAPADRRVIQLAVTDKGKAVRRRGLALLNAKFRPRLDAISAQDLQVTIDTLRKIVQPLDPETPRADS
jgi:DNA-binding MarR family transcriptional regulator